MYVEKTTTKTKSGKIHTCYMLRESYRENGKIKKRTIANLSNCAQQEIDAIKLALQHKGDIGSLGSIKDSVHLTQGLSVGAVYTVYSIAKRLGIEKALGTSRDGKLALWQVIARVIEQGSRLSAARLAQTTAACDILGIRDGFDENSLYENLAWLTDNQQRIERRLLKIRRDGAVPTLFLYDVTSSYLEGQNNDLAKWGYNRDKKKGKKQVVVGLLCDELGAPVSVEVFAGNTQDPSTFKSQIEKASNDYGCRTVTFVGDRGMIKSAQIDDLKAAGFYYITAITKPQIEKLVRDGVFQMGLFQERLCEVVDGDVRYVVRRNPQRAKEIEANRLGKLASIEKIVADNNAYLAKSKRANSDKALDRVKSKIEKLNLEGWLGAEANGRVIKIVRDEETLAQESKLDGCYAIKSDLPSKVADKNIVHERYKDLGKVEQAFRTSKSGMLEMRPWYVRTEQSTRGHALVVMLAYLVVHKLQSLWSGLDTTVEEGLDQLSSLCSIQISLKEGGTCHQIPEPREKSAELLKAAGVSIPNYIPDLGAIVATRKSLAKG